MSSLEWVRVGALLTLGALVVLSIAKLLASNGRRLWRRVLPARFHGDYCHCDACMRREAAESEISHVIARLREAALSQHHACDAMNPPQYTADARMYVRGGADALGSFADDLAREQREGSR